MNRGSQASGLRVPIGLLASMRPRFMNRGSCRGLDLDSLVVALQ